MKAQEASAPVTAKDFSVERNVGIRKAAFTAREYIDGLPASLKTFGVLVIPET
jgi:hypothetical protein